MEKVKLKKYHAGAITWLLNQGYSKEWITRAHLQDPLDWCSGASDLRNLDFDTLVKALYIGYEVDMTPEEQLGDIYNKYEENGLKQEHPIAQERYHLICQGIKIAVDTLGLKITGING